MTTLALQARRQLSTGVRDMLRTPWVLAVASTCATIVALGLLGVVGWLLYTQRDAQTILNLVNLFLTAFLFKRIGDVDARTQRVEQNTNGHTTRLLDVALKNKDE